MGLGNNVAVGVAVLTITVSDYWESVFPNLDSVGLEILCHRGKPLPPGDRAIFPLNIKLAQLSDVFIRHWLDSG